MKLSFDSARCSGYWNPLPFGKQLNTTCIDCARRTQAEHGDSQDWLVGIVVVDGVCNSKIKDEL